MEQTKECTPHLDEQGLSPDSSTDEHIAAKPETDGAELAVGELLDARYKIDSLLATGSISEIFQALDTATGKTVAIKVLYDTVCDADAQREILAKTEKICSFTHPNVVPVLGLGFTSSSRLYLVLEYAQGVTLSYCLDDDQCLSEDDIVSVFLQIVDALIKMHDEELIFRGLKPSNIILRPAGNDDLSATLLDYGPAVLLSGSTALLLPNTAELFVSPLYMSPEQIAGKVISSQADIYSIGCVMYEAVTGIPLINGETFEELKDRHLNHKPKPIDEFELKTRISYALVHIIEKAIGKDSNNQYQTMKQLRQDLNRHKMSITLRKIPPPPPPPVERRRVSRKPRFIEHVPIAILTLVFFLIATGVLISEVWISARTGPELPFTNTLKDLFQ